MGLITTERFNFVTNTTSTNKANAKTKRAMNILLEMTYHIWINRCIANAEANKSTQDSGCMEETPISPITQ